MVFYPLLIKYNSLYNLRNIEDQILGGAQIQAVVDQANKRSTQTEWK